MECRIKEICILILAFSYYFWLNSCSKFGAKSSEIKVVNSLSPKGEDANAPIVLQQRQSPPKYTVLPSKYRYGKHRKNGRRKSVPEPPPDDTPVEDKHIELSHFKSQLLQRKKIWTLNLSRRIFSVIIAIFSLIAELFSLIPSYEFPLDDSTRLLSLSVFLLLISRIIYYLHRRVYHRAFMVLLGYFFPLTAITALFVLLKPKYAWFLKSESDFASLEVIRELVLNNAQVILTNKKAPNEVTVNSLLTNLQLHFGKNVLQYSSEAKERYTAIQARMLEIIRGKVEEAIKRNTLSHMLSRVDFNLMIDYSDACSYCMLAKYYLYYFNLLSTLDVNNSDYLRDALSHFVNLYQDCWLDGSSLIDGSSEFSKAILKLLSEYYSCIQRVFASLQELNYPVVTSKYNLPKLLQIRDVMQDSSKFPKIDLICIGQKAGEADYYVIWKGIIDSAIHYLESNLITSKEDDTSQPQIDTECGSQSTPDEEASEGSIPQLESEESIPHTNISEVSDVPVEEESESHPAVEEKADNSDVNDNSSC